MIPSIHKPHPDDKGKTLYMLDQLDKVVSVAAYYFVDGGIVWIRFKDGTVDSSAVGTQAHLEKWVHEGLVWKVKP